MVAFVILHYKNMTDTLECIKSIRNLKGECKIIVVDNHTVNDDEELLLKKHCDDFLKMNENLGYAKANNIGCKYAIDKYKPDFIIVSNNDIVIYDNNFINKIYDIYKKDNFDLLGSKIDTNNGQSVNPFPVYKTLDEIKKQITKTKKLIKIYSNILLRNMLSIYLKTKYLFLKEKLAANGKKKEYGVALHGCFIIFSKKYFDKFETAFYNETFLYHEEEFLYQRIINHKLVSVYDPSISVFHKEGASLNFNYHNEYKKLVFRNKEILKSLELLKEEIETKEGEKNE